MNFDNAKIIGQLRLIEKEINIEEIEDQFMDDTFHIGDENVEGTYGFQLLQYLNSLEYAEVLPSGEPFKILSLSIEWPAEILIEA